jgi:hypothetical protein
MKGIMSLLALAVALSFTGPAFAGDVKTAKTEADGPYHPALNRQHRRAFTSSSRMLH